MEHATIAVMLQKGVRPPLGGYSTFGGFFVFGRAPTELVVDASYQALERLREGRRELAISPYCGTNIVVGALLAGLVSSLILGRSKSRIRRIPAAAAGIAIATIASRPLGTALQRHYTTLADLGTLEISRVRRLYAGPLSVHRVSTRLPPR